MMMTIYSDHFSRLAVTSVAGQKAHTGAVPGVASHWCQFGCSVRYLSRMTRRWHTEWRGHTFGPVKTRS